MQFSSYLHLRNQDYKKLLLIQQESSEVIPVDEAIVVVAVVVVVLTSSLRSSKMSGRITLREAVKLSCE